MQVVHTHGPLYRQAPTKARRCSATGEGALASRCSVIDLT